MIDAIRKGLAWIGKLIGLRPGPDIAPMPPRKQKSEDSK